MKWPSLIGVTTRDGDVCIGQASSRSKHANTRYMFISPEGKRLWIYPENIPGHLKRLDARNTALLSNALRDVVQAKPGVVPFDRGTVAPQLVDDRLFLYEAGPRGTMWPRYTWHVRTMGFLEALWAAITQEMANEAVVVGVTDNRLPVEVEWWNFYQRRLENGLTRAIWLSRNKDALLGDAVSQTSGDLIQWVKPAEAEGAKEALAAKGWDVR